MGHINKAYIFTVVYSLTGVAILCQTNTQNDAPYFCCVTEALEVY